MKQVVIENPIINSPFNEPTRHFRFSDEGITNEIVEARRISSYFIPIAKPRKKGSDQLVFDTEWTEDRIEENKFINQVRERVGQWRKQGHPWITKTTKMLLELVITNFHALQLREKVSAGKLTKSILGQKNGGAFTETPDQMVRRVCRELGSKKNIVILNDEAHHCSRRCFDQRPRRV